MWFTNSSYLSRSGAAALWTTYPCAAYGWTFGHFTAPNDMVVFSQSDPAATTPYYHLTVIDAATFIETRYVVDLFANDGVSGFHGSDLVNIGGFAEFNVTAGRWVDATTRKVYAIGLTDPNPEATSITFDAVNATHSAIGAEIHSAGSDFAHGDIRNVAVWDNKDPGEEALQHLTKGHQHPYFVKPKGMVAFLPLDGYIHDWFGNNWTLNGGLKGGSTSFRIPKRYKAQPIYGRQAVGRRAEGRPMTGV
jgi:hypothetical protein